MTKILKAFAILLLIAINNAAYAGKVEINKTNAPEKSTYDSELRLLPEGCYATFRDKSTVESCNIEWTKVKAEKEVCENDKQGILIRDDARRKVVCVKQNI